MMHINTHEAFKQLVDAGLKEKAAETIIKVINETRKSDIDRLATKEDLKDAKAELKLEIANVRTELVKEIGLVKKGVFEAKLTAAKFHAELKEEITDLKGKFGTMQWMMGFLLAMSSAIILKLFW